MRRVKWLVPALYIVFLMLPIYWLLSMSFKNTNEILTDLTNTLTLVCKHISNLNLDAKT